MSKNLKSKKTFSDITAMNSIIIIDEDENILCLIERALENDFKVYQSSSSFEAIESIHSLFPDLIILSAKMSHMDGYELCSKLKTNESTQNIPIIFTSDKSSSPSRSLAYRLGAIHYLQKPLDLTELKLLANAIMAQIKIPFNQNLLEFEDLFLDVRNCYCGDDYGEYKLTRGECIILEALMLSKNETVGREVLANKISRYNDQISFRTVDSHICSIRKKIKLSGLRITSIYNVGYRLQKMGKQNPVNSSKQLNT